MKTITKFICAAFATVTLVMGALTANGALNDLFASVDSGGNGGGFIYQFTPVGVQSTFASGVSRPRGVGYGKTGNLFVANNIVNGPMSEGYVVKITPDGVQSPFFTFSGNYFLEGLTLDQSGNVFVVALGVSPDPLVTIYKITPDGVPSTFATPPSLQSFGLAFDSAGNLYTGVNFESEPAQIWKYAPDGTSSVFATASSPDFDLSDLAFDRFGNLFVSVGNGLGQSLILRYAPDGTESPFASDINSVRGLAFDRAGNLFLADVLGGNILKFTPGGAMTVFASGIAVPEFLTFQLRPAPRPRPLPHPRR